MYRQVESGEGVVDYTPDAQTNVPVSVHYGNVLPANLRHGKTNVMPLMPKNSENMARKDHEMLRSIIENSAFTLSQSKKRNNTYLRMEKEILCGSQPQ